MKTPPDKDGKAQRIGQLIALYIQGVISPEEHDELDAWVAQSDENMQLFEDLTDEKNIEKGLAEMQRTDWKERSTKLLEIAARKQKNGPSIRNWLIAASVIFLSGFGWWYLSKNNSDKKKPLLAYQKQADKAPGSHKALLTLGNGKTVMLDGGQKGNLAIEGNVQVVKTDSSLLYNTFPKAGIAESIVYNKLSTPRGGMYSVVLADGTKVWLNAASFIYYPTAFTKKERRVEIGGEAYFDVASFKKGGARQPFIVSVNGIEIEVLGTHFNVNAYSDEEGSTVVLLKGAVKVRKGTATRLLQPGQMATIDKTSDAIVVKKADAVGWKEGLFVFNDADIGSIARQLARWYDVEIDIKDPVTEHLNATIPRTLALNKVTNLLEKMGVVHFTLSEGKLQIHK